MAVSIGKYHLFQRRLMTGAFWYYWYEEDGKRVADTAVKTSGRPWPSRSNYSSSTY
ncbi:MAG: hypothetical protein LBR47_00820 [Spirochaetaceae bacterium]|nr:hypothetical protein [Spirochaetaceae bacterium]